MSINFPSALSTDLKKVLFKRKILVVGYRVSYIDFFYGLCSA